MPGVRSECPPPHPGVIAAPVVSTSLVVRPCALLTPRARGSDMPAPLKGGAGEDDGMRTASATEDAPRHPPGVCN